jgi:hypothetical protein
MGAAKFPDGSTIPTFPIGHKSCYQLKPLSSGELMFAITPNALGGLAMCKGIAVAPRYNTNSAFGAIGWASETTTWPTDTALANYNGLGLFNGAPLTYYTLPWTEWQKGNPLDISQNNNFLAAQDWRVISSKAKICFTGPVLNNSGAVSVGRQVISVKNISQPGPAGSVNASRMGRDLLTYETLTVPASNALTPYFGQITNVDSAGASNLNEAVHGNLLPSLRMCCSSRGPTNIPEVCALQNSQSLPARETFCVENVISDYEFQPFVDNAIAVYESNEGVNIPCWGQLILGSTPTFGGSVVTINGEQVLSTTLGGFGHATTTFVSMEGLSDTAGIFVEVENCIEYTVAYDSTVGRFASPSPPKDQTAIDLVAAVQKHAPVVKQEGEQSWITDAVSWYGNAMKKAIGGTYAVGGALLKGFGITGPGDIADLLAGVTLGGGKRLALN